MGFGGIITTGISIAILLVAGYMILAGLSYTLNAAIASAATVSEIKAGQMDTALEIANVTRVNETTLEFNVTNAGNTQIADVSGMDVLMKYVDPVNGQCVKAVWLGYVPGAGSPVTGDGQWYSTGVISPVRSTTGTVMLMPGETMAVRAVISVPHPADTGMVEMAAPNGVYAMTQFDFRI
jgi:archaellum component FlaF (FlaF/FlaG flagellin family)